MIFQQNSLLFLIKWFELLCEENCFGNTLNKILVRFLLSTIYIYNLISKAGKPKFKLPREWISPLTSPFLARGREKKTERDKWSSFRKLWHERLAVKDSDRLCLKPHTVYSQSLRKLHIQMLFGQVLKWLPEACSEGLLTKYDSSLPVPLETQHATVSKRLIRNISLS